MIKFRANLKHISDNFPKSFDIMRKFRNELSYSEDTKRVC